MGLSREEITRLLTPKKTEKSASGKKIDTSIRTHEIWFLLATKIYDEDTKTLASCENPECIDPREGKGSVVAEVNGMRMCRYCFLSGWNR